MWLWFALTAPFFFAVTGFIDKYLLTKVTQNVSASAFTIISGLAAAPFAILFGFFAGSDVWHVSLLQGVLAFASGGVTVWSYYYYYRALEKADASLVFAAFEITIAFNYLFGRFFLHEHLTVPQLFAILLVVGGAILLTTESYEGKWRIKTSLLVFILAAALLYSAAETLFKGAALETGFMATQFYNYAAYGIVSIFVLIHPLARRNFLQTVQARGRQAWSLAVANEAIYLVGMLLANYALVLAPIAAVQAAVSVESVYTIIIGVFLTIFFPHIIKENLNRGHVLLKLTSIALIIGGAILLAL